MDATGGVNLPVSGKGESASGADLVNLDGFEKLASIGVEAGGSPDPRFPTAEGMSAPGAGLDPSSFA